jgi:hypothetical protein
MTDQEAMEHIRRILGVEGNEEAVEAVDTAVRIAQGNGELLATITEQATLIRTLQAPGEPVSDAASEHDDKVRAHRDAQTSTDPNDKL